MGFHGVVYIIILCEPKTLQLYRGKHNIRRAIIYICIDDEI